MEQTKSALRMAALNSHFSGNMASAVERVQLGDTSYDEIIDFEPHHKVSREEICFTKHWCVE